MTSRRLPLLALLALALVAAPGCDSSFTDALEELFGCSVAEVSFDRSVNGSLSPRDCTDDELLDGEFDSEGETYYFDLYGLEVDASETVEIDLTSTEFDTLLGLFDDTGDLLESDDDGGTGTNSRLVETLTPGTYVLIVTSFGAEETGAYRLALDSGLSIELLESEAAAKAKARWLAR